MKKRLQMDSFSPQHGGGYVTIDTKRLQPPNGRLEWVRPDHLLIQWQKLALLLFIAFVAGIVIGSL